MNPIFLCIVSAALGAIAGSLATKRVNHQDLRLARQQGLHQGRREQEHRADFLERRVVHLEASIRRFAVAGGPK